MTNLLCKAIEYVWMPEAHHLFKQLKDAFTSTPVLAYPDPSKAFIMEDDVSNVTDIPLEPYSPRGMGH